MGAPLASDSDVLINAEDGEGELEEASKGS